MLIEGDVGGEEGAVAVAIDAVGLRVSSAELAPVLSAGIVVVVGATVAGLVLVSPPIGSGARGGRVSAACGPVHPAGTTVESKANSARATRTAIPFLREQGELWDVVRLTSVDWC
jgi:hypothetical protein